MARPWISAEEREESLRKQQEEAEVSLLPCPICSGEKVLYQKTTHTKLYLDTFGKSSVLITEYNPCPPYANCSLKDISANSAFVIKYCPECGRDLSIRTSEERGGEK